MDEDILFDNIYIGHDPAQAKQFAAETFDAKIKIEQGKEEAEQKAAEKAAEAAGGFVGRTRAHVNLFIERARESPLDALKEMPQVAGGLGAAFAGLLGLVGLLGGVLGGASKVEPKDAKKVDAPAKSKSAPESSKSTAVQAKDSAKKRTPATAHDE
jgi:calnexin